MKNDKIYILPKQDKPVKLVFDELPCPRAFIHGCTIRCKFSKIECNDYEASLVCTKQICDYPLKFE